MYKSRVVNMFYTLCMSAEHIQMVFRTYAAELNQNLPDPEIIQSVLLPSSCQESFQIPLLAEFGLDVEMEIGFPAVYEVNDMLGFAQPPHD